jgi:hypothetical protein
MKMARVRLDLAIEFNFERTYQLIELKFLKRSITIHKQKLNLITSTWVYRGAAVTRCYKHQQTF